jgi:hypothetical protein
MVLAKRFELENEVWGHQREVLIVLVLELRDDPLDALKNRLADALSDSVKRVTSLRRLTFRIDLSAESSRLKVSKVALMETRIFKISSMGAAHFHATASNRDASFSMARTVSK